MNFKYKIQSQRVLAYFIALAILPSCEDILELEPAQSISNELALSDDESVKQALIGAYDNLSTSGLFGGEVLRNSELYAGDGQLNWLGTFTAPREIFQRNILSSNGDVNDFWVDAYATINACNAVLNALDVVIEEDKAQIEGEAKCLRGLCYFELTKYFGQQYETSTLSNLAAPIVLTPTMSFDESTFVSRNTVTECYAQVISDLTSAESLLPEDNGFFCDKQVAAAILARVYLQMEDYANARDAADRVISSGNYDLVSVYADCFGQDENTEEDIFALQVSEQDGSNAMNTYFATNTNGGRGDIEILEAHLALYDTADVRFDLFYEQGGTMFCGKFNNEFGNLPIIRLAEMYLVRAECNERLGTSVGASPLDDYNIVHTRAGMAEAGSVTLDDILFERHLEIAFEGQRLWDVKRLKGTVATMNYNDPKLVFPIPQAEIEVNPNLVQNEGY
ncbi:MAG: RagB/SusD family nutrient uptake outer membrane protein [Chitinophagales bacterium]